MSNFTLDIERIRKDAREAIETGAVTANYRADRQTIIELLDGALATEWLCILRYTQHALTAQGIHAEAVAQHFAEHAKDEAEHAHLLGERIKQLGGSPNLDPQTFATRGQTQYTECDSLLAMIKENLVAERIAIEAYSDTIRYIGDTDPTTRRILEHILEVEEEHADDMADLLVTHDGVRRPN